jgi:hypothetical protein
MGPTTGRLQLPVDQQIGIDAIAHGVYTDETVEPETRRMNMACKRRTFLKIAAVASLTGLAARAYGATELPGKTGFYERLEYVGVAASDPENHVWGCSPVKCEKGLYHLFGARFKTPFEPGWRTDSHIVRFVSDTPRGPFTMAEVVYRGEPDKPRAWNYFGITNPCIKKVDDKYALFFIGRPKSMRPQTIGMMVADSVEGPWSEPVNILRPSEDPKNWTYQSGNVCNPAFVKFKDKYYLYYKSKNARYGVAVADKLEGPYIHHPTPITKTNKTIEDGTAFVWNGKVCLVTTDNHGAIKRGGGLLWRSEDGVDFGLPVMAYDHFDKYVTREQFPRTHSVRRGRPIRIKGYTKIVRPQILMEDGRPAWLYGPTGVARKGREYTDCHVFKLMTDEEVLEKRGTSEKSE